MALAENAVGFIDENSQETAVQERLKWVGDGELGELYFAIARDF